MTDSNSNELPHVTAKSARILGKMRIELQDFVVDEVPAYSPSGQGDHLFVHFEKAGITTPVAVGAIARALDVPRQRSSFAGLKDRQGITTQWASFEHADGEKLLNVDLPGVRIIEHARHTNKLKTGHLKSNRFAIRVREPEAGLDVAQSILAELLDIGCPNYYGEQRFGRDGDNAQSGAAFITGAAPMPKDRFKRKFLFSAFQSDLFNRWLSQRVLNGELAKAIDGDLMRKEDSGGIFTSDDLADLQLRVERFEISPTGPMFGAEMRAAEAIAARRETELLAASGVSLEMLARFKKLGAGTRRQARIRPHNARVEQEDGALIFYFELPKGAYATTIMREFMKSPSPAV